MLKKMMLLAMTVGALVAFSAPAVAQAGISLEEPETGETLKAGAEIKAVPAP